jgi:glyoxylase-like metal-dependent hydrolase (beta-lactamase superfamily II)
VVVAVPFDRDFAVEYGRVDQVSPLIRRVVAENPGRFTFTGTGTYIVGHGSVAIIDPGPLVPAHIEALQRAVAGEEVTHLFITHTHGDHSPAAEPLKAATGARTYGFGPHPVADIEARRGDAEPHDQVPIEERSDLAFVPDVVVADGDVFHGGGDVFHGGTIEGAGWTIEALHTPGHISNHLCFALREERALFTGDHVMGWSTSVIPSPDGDLGHYLDNLRRLLDRDDEIYWPTHGAPIRDPHPFVRALIAHREERTRQILDRLARGDDQIDAVVAVLYADVDPKLHPAAARSVLAHLVHLVRTGQVVADGEPLDLTRRWRLAEAPA